MSEGDNENVVVIDNGTGLIKAGFCGEDTPRSVFPSVGGYTKNDELFDNNDNSSQNPSDGRSFLVGFDAQSKRDRLSLRNPMEAGEITDWETMEKIWEWTFEKELGVDNEGLKMPVLMADSPLTSIKSREKMAEILFEKFSVSGFYVYTDAVLSLFSSGRTRGMVVEAGQGVAHCVPVFEGYALPHGIIRSDFAGYSITDCIMKALSKTNTTNKPFTVEMVRDMKEKLCYIHEDFRSATNPHSKQPLKNLVYELPDGSVISVPADPFIRGPEALFNPSVIDGSEHKSLASLAAHSIGKCDDDLQVDLFGTVVLAGGTSIIPGFADRLEKDMSREAPADKKVAVLPDSQRKYAAWIGGSMFASLGTFGQIQITKHEYEDGKDTIVQRKCF